MKQHLFFLATLAASLLLGFASIPYLPDQVAIHWGPSGVADGFTSKWFAILLFPIILVVLQLLLTFLPNKKGKNDTQSASYSDRTISLVQQLIMLFVLVMHILIIAENIWGSFSMGNMIILLLGCLFIIIGNYMPRLKMNSYMGIRTPWSFKNEWVWKKTQQAGGKIFFTGGVLLLILSIFISESMIWIGLPVLLLVIILSVWISYFYSNKYEDQN
ncbi:SdpI family protein [Brevibacillus daliensis]|uniref:SdpI family protein n=1 Tax=Brevibacillus daliensis TaxID=2892995 RepID=UPI001E43FCAA|nr:SdpI family protein [Brevibacillus daliensis]